MKTANDGYTNDDSLCTVCIQAKHKQKLVEVPVKSTMKLFELVHSDVCSPYLTPTFGEKRQYIIFINNYRKFTWGWPLRTRNAETCTSTYQSTEARVDSIGYEMK